MTKKTNSNKPLSLDDLARERLSRATIRQIETLAIRSIEIVDDEDDTGGSALEKPGIRAAFDTDGKTVSIIVKGVDIPVPTISLRKILIIITGGSGMLYLLTRWDVFESIWVLLVTLLK